MANIGVMGATGEVGGEILRMLEERNVEVGNLRVFARKSGDAERQRYVKFRAENLIVEDLARADMRNIDIALVSIGSAAVRNLLPRIREHGAVVIDNSSAFRMQEDVPLVVPEINSHMIQRHHGIIANPNCVTIILLMAAHPLHQVFGMKRISATTYQAASGAGRRGLAELQAQLVSHHCETGMDDGRWKQKMHSDVFPHPIALNLFPQVGSFVGSTTDEELKVLNEGRKIMSHPGLLASTTCVRVPVERVHCIDVLAQFERTVDLAHAYGALRKMPGLDVFEGNEVPTPLQYAGKCNCAVARLRIDPAFENSLRFWVLGDQLLKGAALNAVQIAERLIQ